MYANLNYQANKVTDTGGKDINNYPNVVKEGQPVYAFYYHTVEKPAFNADGTYNQKIGAIESNDYQYLGKPFPSVNGSFGFDLKLFNHFTSGQSGIMLWVHLSIIKASIMYLVWVTT